MRRIIVIVFLLVIIGIGMPKLLTSLSLYFDRSKTDVTEVSQETTLLFPPVFEPMAEATNSASFAVRGFSLNAEKVEIYINNVLKDTIYANRSDGSFETSDLRLYEGDNVIKGIAVDENGKKSSASAEVTVIYSKNAPKLEITSPQDNEHFTGNKRIKIEGKTDVGADVKINQRWAVVRSDGSFTFSTDLNDGDNSFEIIAEDQAGNKTTVARIITYSQN